MQKPKTEEARVLEDRVEEEMRVPIYFVSSVPECYLSRCSSLLKFVSLKPEGRAICYLIP